MGVADRVSAAGLLSIAGQHPLTITSTRFMRRLHAKLSNLQVTSMTHVCTTRQCSQAYVHFWWKLSLKY